MVYYLNSPSKLAIILYKGCVTEKDLCFKHITNPHHNHRSRMTNHSRECCRSKCCPSHHRTTPHKSTLQAANPKVI